MASIDVKYPTVLRALRAAECDPRPAPPPQITLANGGKITRSVRAQCPACGNRSLTLCALDDGGALIFCHAHGCAARRAMAALGLGRETDSAEVRRAALVLDAAIGRAKARRAAAALREVAP